MTSSNLDDINASEQLSYNICAIAIFLMVAFTFLFPCNKLIPLDRRTVGVLGATLVYICRQFIFTSTPFDGLEAVDFDVLVLLSAIMAINHIIVHLKETKVCIDTLQNLIKGKNKVKLYNFINIYLTFIYIHRKSKKRILATFLLCIYSCSIFNK